MVNSISDKSFFTRGDAGDIGLEAPGEYPFTRGLFPMINREAPWAVSANCGFGLPEETNAMQKEFIRECQEKPHLNPLGRPAVAFYLDLPTQLGYDSDNPLAHYDVGKCGTPINSLEDMEILLCEIPIDSCHITFITSPTAPIMLAMYLAYAENQGVAYDSLMGSLCNDALLGPISDNMIAFEPRATYKLALEIVDYCMRNVGHFSPVFFHAYSCREKDATAVKELAFILSLAIEVVRGGIGLGLNVDDFAGNLLFFFSLHSNFFEEVAKLRAARRMWARIMKEEFGAKDPRTWMCKVQGQTGGSTLTAQEPLNNIARVAIGSLVGALGGVQMMVPPSYLEALSVPTKHAQHIAYQTQHILQEEIGITEVVDPLGGSYYLEALTDRIEREAQNYMDIIKKKGGYIAALEEGYLQEEVDRASARFQEKVEKGERVIVGVNKYVGEECPPVEIFSYNPDLKQIMAGRLKKLRKRRDSAKVERSLKTLESAARSQEPLIPHLIEAAKRYATVGEMMDTLREVFGRYVEAGG
ncbi:MAG: acyl-CoA mutase large subunit family protein [Deltaproteobacteria bacterium]|nr:acyl-CoA mutase large subunit family protein [Deltaproteobacteria bacterium]